MTNDNREKLQADPFVTAYVTAMFWADIENQPDEDFPEREAGDYDLEDLAQEAIERILEDCKTFQEGQADWLSNAYEMAGYGKEQAGHDFWLSRCGHGVGFWDRNLGETGEALTETVGWRTSYPELNPYLGDDGLIYLA